MHDSIRYPSRRKSGKEYKNARNHNEWHPDLAIPHDRQHPRQRFSLWTVIPIPKPKPRRPCCIDDMSTPSVELNTPIRQPNLNASQRVSTLAPK